MTPLITIKIPGRPIPKGRPRFDRRTGRVITPKRTREYERFAALCARMAMAGAGLAEPLEGPIGLDVTVLFQRPKTISRSHVLHGCPGRVLLSCGGSFPDLSNVVKSVEDALQGIVFADDHQVCLLRSSRSYAAQDEEPGVYVEIWRP